MNWDKRILHQELEGFLVDTISASLSKLSIQVALLSGFIVWPLVCLQFTGINFDLEASQPMSFAYCFALKE